MSNPETDPLAEDELYFCPLCPGEMILKMLPVRNWGTDNQEAITGYKEIEAIQQMDPPPEDIEWMELLLCTSCDLAIEPDEYDDAPNIY